MGSRRPEAGRFGSSAASVRKKAWLHSSERNSRRKKAPIHLESTKKTKRETATQHKPYPEGVKEISRELSTSANPRIATTKSSPP